jgi:hypothetical protein
VLSRFHGDLVDVTPDPVFTRLERLHEGMANRMKVLGGVLVLRGITASDVAARQAQAQVDPGVAYGQTFLASLRGTRADILNLIEMGAWGAHAITPRSDECQEVLLLTT